MEKVIVIWASIICLAFIGLCCFTRLRLRTIGFVVVGIVVLFIGANVWLSRAVEKSIERRLGPKRVFELTAKPAFLTEALALEKALVILSKDELGKKNWQPMPRSTTSSPDGKRDTYLVRDLDQPNRGEVYFSNSVYRLVISVELDGEGLICQRRVPK